MWFLCCSTSPKRFLRFRKWPEVLVPSLFINGRTVTICRAAFEESKKVWTHVRILYDNDLFAELGVRRAEGGGGLVLVWRHVSWQEVLLFAAPLTLTGFSCLWTVPWSSPIERKGLWEFFYLTLQVIFVHVFKTLATSTTLDNDGEPVNLVCVLKTLKRAELLHI